MSLKPALFLTSALVGTGLVTAPISAQAGGMTHVGTCFYGAVTVEATGDNTDGQFVLKDGVLTSTVPIRPGKLTCALGRRRLFPAHGPADRGLGAACALRQGAPRRRARRSARHPDRVPARTDG